MIKNIYKYKNTDLYYELEENNKPLVVFIHGFNATMSSMAILRPKERNYDMLLIDSPGNGKSISKDKLSIEFYNEVISSFLKTINREMIVVGHSLGAATALSVSKESFVKHTILISPFNPFLNDSREEFLKKLKPENEEEALESSKSLVFNKDLVEYWKGIEKRVGTFLRYVKNNEQAFAPVLEQIVSKEYRETNLKKLYEEASKDVSVISGVQDTFVKKESIEMISNEYNIKSTFIDNCGHAPIYEQTDFVNNYISKLINI